jgi:hypothetical protein
MHLYRVTMYVQGVLERVPLGSTFPRFDSQAMSRKVERLRLAFAERVAAKSRKGETEMVVVFVL